MKTKVGIVGYGTIGKRVADAVLKQDDMELVGITGHTCNFKMHVAKAKSIPIYTTYDCVEFAENNIKTSGTIHDLLNKADIICDCTPKKVAAEYKEKYYIPNNVKAIFQGGEKADIAEASFCAPANYDDAVGKQFVRVVSCNTTGLSRSLYALDQAFGIKRARATLIRRGGDPADVKKGPINAIVPSFELPSHHGPDVRTVMPHIEVFTTAVIVPTTLMHMHNLSVVLDKKVTVKEVLDVFDKATRIKIIRSNHKIKSTAEIMEYAKDLGFPRGDIPVTCIWEEGVGIHREELFFPQAIHQESIVVPETIDCIRAMMGSMSKEESINKTNASLGL